MRPDGGMAVPWTLDPWTLAAIAGMAMVTYLCRAGGWWLFRRVRPTPMVRAVLGYIPGALFMAYVAPALVAGGPGQWIGAAATVAASVLTRSMTVAILVGTAAAWLVWLG
jgi:uncharacterized membrane protein